MSRRVVVKVIRDGPSVLGEALDFAIERGMRRCDKYTTPLTPAQRVTLEREIAGSFWFWLLDNDVEVK